MVDKTLAFKAAVEDTIKNEKTLEQEKKLRAHNRLFHLQLSTRCKLIGVRVRPAVVMRDDGP